MLFDGTKPIFAKRPGLFRIEALIGQGFERRVDPVGAIAGAVVEHGGCLPDAALGGGGEIVEQEPRGMSRLEEVHGAAGAVEDDGHFVVDVVGDSGRDGAGAIDASKSFHDRIVADGWKAGM